MQYKWKEATLLVSLLRTALKGDTTVIPEDTDFENLIALSQLQKVEAMVAIALEKCENVPPEVLERFRTIYKKEVSAYCIRHNEGVKILNALEVNGVDCVPLKGWLIADLYPNPVMRYMCDMDILFKPEQSGDVQRILESLGYTPEELGGNPEVYYKKPIMNIEMHKALIRDKTDHFDTSWDRVQRKKNCDHTFLMTEEDYYIFMLAHLHKHFVGGGTGVRYICDFEVYENAKGAALDREYVDAQLERSGILEFDKKVRALCRAWFHDGEADEDLIAFSKKLLYGAVFGTHEQKAKNQAVQNLQSMPGKSKTTKAFFYYLTLIFPGLSVMRDLFPVLSKAPFLLPVFWVIRGIKILLGDKKGLKQIKSLTDNVSQEDLDNEV